MEISDLIDAAARAAVEHDHAPTAYADPATNIRLAAAIHDARQALATQNISDDRLAAAISLAKLETRVEAGTATPAIQNEIDLLKEFLND